MFDGLFRSALAAAGMTQEDVQDKVEAIVTAAQTIAQTVQRIEQRVIRLEQDAGLEPLEFDDETEGAENVRHDTGD